MGRPKKNSSTNSGHPVKKVFALEGLEDVVTEVDVPWDAATKRLTKVARVYGFNRVEVPVVEDAQLYYNFYRQEKSKIERLILSDVDGKQVAVRAHMLPSVLRAYGQHKIYEKAPLSKWFYSGQVAFKEQDGKVAGDYEYGLEVLGTFNHLTEAQVIGAVWEFLHSLGLADISLEINNIGESTCQSNYQDTLSGFLSGKKYDLCDDCNEHLKGRLLNIFRCQNLDCQAVVSEAPTILDFLDEASHKHFTNILEALDELGVPYQLNPFYAGKEGYSKTNIVIKYKGKGQPVILGEGGYHDELMASVSGKNWCSFGFCGSLSVIHELLESSKVEITREQKNDVFLVPLGELAAKKSLRLFRDLIGEKIAVYDHFGTSGVKNQLKQAEVYKAPISLIMGQKEAVDEVVILRDVKSGMQEIISYDKIVEEVKKRLGR